jgi:hypothetical protein
MKLFFDYLFHPRIQGLWKPFKGAGNDWEWYFSLFGIDLYKTEYKMICATGKRRKIRILNAIKITVLNIEFAWKWWTE